MEGTLVEQSIMLRVEEWQLIADVLENVDDDDRDFARDCHRLFCKILELAPEVFES